MAPNTAVVECICYQSGGWSEVELSRLRLPSSIDATAENQGPEISTPPPARLELSPTFPPAASYTLGGPTSRLPSYTW